MEFLFSLLGIGHPISNLTKKSLKSVNIFNKTINDLTKVNAKVEEHVTKRQTKVEQLQNEQSYLNKIKDDNQKVIGKISKIFE